VAHAGSISKRTGLSVYYPNEMLAAANLFQGIAMRACFSLESPAPCLPSLSRRNLDPRQAELPFRAVDSSLTWEWIFTSTRKIRR